MGAQRPLPFASCEDPGLEELRARLAALGVDGGEGLSPEVVRDLARLLRKVYPVRGERRPPPVVPDADVSLAFRHAGEHYVAEEADFVHPALGEELARALDDYVRRELLDPSLLCAPAPERLARARRIEALRAAWGRVSARLAAREAERALHWRRPKLVLSSRWCVCVGRIPRALWPEVLACGAQRREWEELCGEAPPRRNGEAWLAERQTLVLDTVHYSHEFTGRLLEALGDLETVRDGLLIQADNAHALRLLRAGFRGRVRCAYLDPPFNTSVDGRAYADRFGRAAWLCFMEERLRLVAELLCEDGTLYAHIDGHEKERLRLLCDRYLHCVGEIVWRIGWVSGFKTRARKFIRNHDTIYHYGKSPRPLFNKRYLPYPEGYVRRDGKPPRGKGIPLEDTWNCSPADRLDSIQIMSFSREKVGRGNLTQKNENLLERMLEASSLPGDWVLDPFLGSGTTCAVAQKMGRRWIGVERSALLEDVALPRLKRVLHGDPYGISAARGWRGGGAFQVLRLEGYADAMANARGRGTARGHLQVRAVEGLCVLRSEPLAEPETCRVRTATGWAAVDAVESFARLLGLRLGRRRRVPGALLLWGEDAAGAPALVVWCSGGGPGELELPPLPSAGRAWINGPPELLASLEGWRIERVEEAFAAALRVTSEE